MKAGITLAALLGLAGAIMSPAVSHAQVLLQPPGSYSAIPPLTAPPRPPPPQIEVPAVPRMNSPPPFALQNTTPGTVEEMTPPKQKLQPQRRPSYSKRVARCLNEGAAMGLGPNERAAYSRACANQ